MSSALASSATASAASPLVSIILPTYNRASFLPQAFKSIAGQSFSEWELVVVDDGSTDGSQEVIERCSVDLHRPPRYIFQNNQGPYAARNTGLDHAHGKYVAFFDSDDVWLPHHLADCVRALEENPDVDWVYGSCRVVRFGTGEVLAPSTFYESGRPRPFMRLRTRPAGSLRIFADPKTTTCIIRYGHFCGLQNSVFRREALGDTRFVARRGHESEDRLAVVRAFVTGRTFGYFDNVHVIYHVHGANSSAPGQSADRDKALLIMSELVLGRERLREQVRLTGSERRALDWRISQDLFWSIGYNLHWQHGQRTDAIRCYRRALAYWPWSARFWKTYLFAEARRLTPGLPG